MCKTAWTLVDLDLSPPPPEILFHNSVHFILMETMKGIKPLTVVNAQAKPKPGIRFGHDSIAITQQ